MIRPLAAAVRLMLLAPALAACAPSDIRWTEQVKLHDGTVIEVKRRTELSATGFPTASRGKPRYHELCYSAKGIAWKSKPEYKPEAFDIIDGKAYVRVPLGGCAACMLHGFPATNSIYFTWSGKEWTQLAEKDAPAQLSFNLLEATHGDDDGSFDARGLISLAEKRKRDASIYYVMDRTKARGLNERPSLRDLCVKCKGIDIRTGSTADVLLPAASPSCSW